MGITVAQYCCYTETSDLFGHVMNIISPRSFADEEIVFASPVDAVFSKARKRQGIGGLMRPIPRSRTPQQTFDDALDVQMVVRTKLIRRACVRACRRACIHACVRAFVCVRVFSYFLPELFSAA